jgi:type I restriction enzyme M protein
MAERIIFIASSNKVGVICEKIEFQYYTGCALSQKQKSIASLHEKAREMGLKKILEVSTASNNELGIKLSAFNLQGDISPFDVPVELNFQSSKVFEFGGPYNDLLNVTSREAKMDKRLKTSGNIIKFAFNNNYFNNEPLTYFYDWLYINTLMQNRILIQQIEEYNVFSDIAFNNEKSINCQAYSLALFKSIINAGINIDELNSPEKYLAIVY